MVYVQFETPTPRNNLSVRNRMRMPSTAGKQCIRLRQVWLNTARLIYWARKSLAVVMIGRIASRAVMNILVVLPGTKFFLRYYAITATFFNPWYKILITLLRYYGHPCYSLIQNSYYVITLLRPPFLILDTKFLLRYSAITATLVTHWYKILITLLRYYGHPSYSLIQNSYYVIPLLRPPLLLLDTKFLLRYYGYPCYSLIQNSYYVIPLLRPPLLLPDTKFLLRYYAITATLVTPWNKIVITLLRCYGHPCYSLIQNSYYVITLLRPPLLLLGNKIVITLLLRDTKFSLRYYAITATLFNRWSKIVSTLLRCYGCPCYSFKQNSYYVITLLRPPLLLLKAKFLFNY